MKKICYLILLFVFSLQISVFAKEINFIQVSDVHLSQKNAEYLKEFVNDVNNTYTNLDFVVFTGDNIDEANKDDLFLFLKIIKGLKFKTYVTLGNHDLMKSKAMTSENYMYAVRKILGSYHSSKADYVFKKGEIVFIVANGVKEVFPGANGYFQKEELKWLDKTLNKYKNKKVVIFQHFPLLDSKQNTSNLYKKEDYLEVLKKHDNVISIISGHYHKNYEQKEDGIYHIITKNFLNNNFYKIITIDDSDGYISTSLIDNTINKKD